MLSKIISFLNAFFLLLLIFTILIHPNNSLNQDLGRHIKLGQIIWETKNIPNTNLFTFTNPSFPFINHHWLPEVFFYFISKDFGIIAITYCKIFIYLISFIFLYKAIKNISNSHLLSSLSISPFILLLINRNDERPEMFGILFFCIYLLLLTQKNKKLLYLIPFLAFLWINSHITFIFGFFLIVLSIFDSYIQKDNLLKIKATILIASLISSLLNPHFISGLFYPLMIFKNYGYSISENQNLFYLTDQISNIFIPMFWMQLIFLIGIVFFSIYKKRFLKKSIFFLILGFVFSIMAIIMLRNNVFFILSSSIVVGFFLKPFKDSKYMYIFGILNIILLILCINLITSNIFYKTFDMDKSFSLEIQENYLGAVNFYKKNNLRGPIFNNFDIGGYLDYKLYPNTQTFVDNRPEAFPNMFFDEYKNAQTYSKEFNKLAKKYNIQTIIISYTDNTGWGEEFLKNLLNKAIDYKIVYLDQWTLVAVKKTSSLAEIDLNNINIKTNNFIELANYYKIMSYSSNKQKTDYLIEKLYEINPNSCMIKVNYAYYLLQKNNLFYKKKAISLLRNTYYCPFTNSVKNEIKNILEYN